MYGTETNIAELSRDNIPRAEKKNLGDGYDSLAELCSTKISETSEQIMKFNGVRTKLRPFLLDLLKKWRGYP